MVPTRMTKVLYPEEMSSEKWPLTIGTKNLLSESYMFKEYKVETLGQRIFIVYM